MRTLRLIGALPVAAALSGCFTNYGPGTIPPARFDYNQRIASTFGLLSNLFSLQSAQSRTAGPLLTVPAGP